jgi:hypothetical protein
MLDQHDGRAQSPVHVEDGAAHVALLFRVHPGHGLVEQQQQHGGGAERAPELHALLQTVRQAPHGGVPMSLQT